MANKLFNVNTFKKHLLFGVNIVIVVCKTIGKIIQYAFNLCENAYRTMPAEIRKRIVSAIIILILLITIILISTTLYNTIIVICCMLMIYESNKMLENIKKTNNNVFVSLRKFVIIYLFVSTLSLIAIRSIYMQGAKITLWIFLTAWGTDCGAYIFGKKYGKLKLAPHISPKKTYEGAICGSIVGIVISIMIYNLFYTAQPSSFSFISFVIVSIIVTVLAQTGDLLESAIKRQCNVKDSGTIIPGHGGIFDRFDSVLLVALFVCIIIFFNGGILF